ncbi:hypothetical protein DS745_00800 [Anaerobacillus alkaliphilus]|uniref:Uncharacterized protein n=1 Tax=Anaerobacillus alkaliphilus TaxID=1548597 RepID=A0A4Q0VZD3_9BACI|nr:hypothetical protein [Anaerobacillus alkaliphilus]RXJ03961.1 hypothetical protein DS745_00800 [Anaerobacillus alkaliphilus]
MNLMDVLLFQDRSELRKLLKESDRSLNINSKRELVEVLYPRLANFDDLKERYQQLSNDAKKVILHLCYDKKMFISKEELNGFVPKRKGNEFHELINELATNGLLFVFKQGNYVVPIQVKNELIRCIQIEIKDNSFILPSSTSDQKEITIVTDIFAFVDFIMDKPLTLTKSGAMYKKDFQALMNVFSYKESLPNDQWRFGYGRRFSLYPDRFSLIYDFCFSNGWLKETADTLTIHTSVEELFEMRINELMQSIVTYWHKLYRRPFPSVRLLYLLLFNSLVEGEAVEEDYLLSAFAPFVNEYYFDTKEDVITKRFLQMLVYLDVVSKVELEHFTGYTIGPSHRFLK